MSNNNFDKKIRKYRQKKDFVMVRYLKKCRDWLKYDEVLR